MQSFDINKPLHHLSHLDEMDQRQLALSVISSLLSDLVYLKCQDLLNSSVLIILGLAIRACYTDTNNNKFMVFTKATKEELFQLEKLQQENLDVEVQTTNYLKQLEKERDRYIDESGESGERRGDRLLRKLIIQNLIKKGEDHNIINANFTKQYYSPKITQIISNVIYLDKYRGLGNYINETDLFIVFRGTNNRNNLLSDLQITSQPTYLTDYVGKFHSGFIKAYNSLEPELAKVINSYIHKHNMIFSGHSLGGALASLASIDFTRRLHQYSETYQIGLITFGSPRITDRQGSQYFSHLLLDVNYPLVFNIRYCNELDPVVYYRPPNLNSLKNPYNHLMSLFKVRGQDQLYTSVVFPLNRQTLTNMVFNYYERRYKGKNLVSKKKFLEEFGNNIVTHFMGNYIINLLQHLPVSLVNTVPIANLTINNLNSNLTDNS